MSKNTATDKKKPPTNPDLDLAVQGINKKFGEGALMRLGDATKM
ncbi:MAG TPA: DNA recombination/repair protein RecA, partial [Opitutae bacterium]|nr:DNA recombination/repair protein RecA [Opitutae bacterium]